MNTNTIIDSIATYLTPDRVKSELVAPWAPSRVTRNSVYNITDDLSSEMDTDSEDDVFCNLVFPDIVDILSDNQQDIINDDNDVDIVPHPNITLFRGNLEMSDGEISEFDLELDSDNEVDNVVVDLLDNTIDLDDETIVMYVSHIQ